MILDYHDRLTSVTINQYQTVKGPNLKSPVRNYDDYDDLDNPKKATSKETAVAQACRLEDHLKAQKSSAKSKMSSNRLSSHLERSVLGSAVKMLHKQYYGLRDASERFRSKATQTDYRETECQTEPWEPPYTIKPGHEPEVLTLLHLTWDHGLPAGRHEVELIHRMRIRRAWERVLPPMDSPANVRIRTELLSALEADHWAFREAEIQFLMNLRMELAEKLARSRDDGKRKHLEARFEKLRDRLNSRKQREIKGIRAKYSRELRKLSMRHRSAAAAATTHQRHGRLKLLADRQLTTYSVPRARYECPRERHHATTTSTDELLQDLKNDEQCRDWLLQSKQRRQKSSSRTTTSVRLCPRVQQKRERQFSQLCRDLEQIEAEQRELPAACSLLKRRPRIPEMPTTPRRSSSESDDEIDDEVNRSESLLRRLVKGRAIQSEILEGKNTYKELIEELQSAQALEQNAEEMRRETRQRKLAEDLASLNESRAREILEAIEGKSIAKTLTFLTDELTRLEAEKRAHALALLAERARIKKQIAEASREQLELNRREELDEMYRQILKINQESVETYLEDIVREGVEWSSAKEAEDYIVRLADKTDEIAKSWRENAEALDEEGLVSDMLYNLVLPEVEKESARQRLQERQRGYLCAAHASIYDARINSREDDTSAGSIDRDNRDGLDRVAEIILDYAGMDDEQDRTDVCRILGDMFARAENRPEH